LIILNAILFPFPQHAGGQTATLPDQQTTLAHATTQRRSEHFGMGINLSTLGLGAEMAVSLSRRSNLRAGFSILGFSHTFNKDGIPYSGHLNFKTVSARYDFFPRNGNFHITPGILIYIADPIKARALVAANQRFTVGGTAFYSDSARPTTADGTITFHRVAPTVTVGWGNWISRREGSRFSFPFEIGLAFQGSPSTTLSFSGNVCLSPGTNCSPAATNPEVQRNVASEQKKISSNLSFLKVYPIISSGFAVRF
jgi:hypothetical protein